MCNASNVTSRIVMVEVYRENQVWIVPEDPTKVNAVVGTCKIQKWSRNICEPSIFNPRNWKSKVDWGGKQK